MRVTVVQGGGLAGLVRTTSADTASLAPTDAAALRAMVGAADVFGLPSRLGPAATRPDALAYEVTVEDGAHRHTVRASDQALPEELRALISWLQSVPGRSERLGPPG
jgi:Emfourin